MKISDKHSACSLARMIARDRRSPSGQKTASPLWARPAGLTVLPALHGFFSQQFLHGGQHPADLLRNGKGGHAGPQGPGLQRPRRPVGQRSAVKARPQGDPPSLPAPPPQLLAVPGPRTRRTARPTGLPGSPAGPGRPPRPRQAGQSPPPGGGSAPPPRAASPACPFCRRKRRPPATGDPGDK